MTEDETTALRTPRRAPLNDAKAPIQISRSFRKPRTFLPTSQPALLRERNLWRDLAMDRFVNSIRTQGTRFVRSDCGAITVDWGLLSGALVGLALAVMVVTSGGLEDVSNDLAMKMTDDDLLEEAFSQILPDDDDVVEPPNLPSD